MLIASRVAAGKHAVVRIGDQRHVAASVRFVSFYAFCNVVLVTLACLVHAATSWAQHMMTTTTTRATPNRAPNPKSNNLSSSPTFEAQRLFLHAIPKRNKNRATRCVRTLGGRRCRADADDHERRCRRERYRHWWNVVVGGVEHRVASRWFAGSIDLFRSDADS